MKPLLKFTSRRFFALAVVASLTTLVGCVVVPRPYSGGQYPQQYPSQQPAPQAQDYYESSVPPPPPRDEVYGVAPAVGWIWLSGYWGWNLGRHVWIGGQWSAPRQGHHWVPHRWERHGNGWRMNHGHWARR